MSGRSLKFFLAGIFLIAVIGFVSSASCSITTSCSPDNTVLRLSGTANAHAEIYSQSNYNYYLCCDFTGTHTCDSSNKVLGLYSDTNAHAEIPSLDNYATDVCFGDLTCTSISGACNAEYPLQMASLSANTNAHLGAYNSYGINICCQMPATPNPFWADENEYALGPTFDIDGQRLEIEVPYPIKLVITDSGLSQGSADFEVWEEDAVFDDSIRTGANVITGTVDANGKAVATWTITQTDIDNAGGGDSDGKYEFYFKGDGIQSENLYVGTTVLYCSEINLCSDYSSQINCETDSQPGSCNVGENTPGCDPDTEICVCEWENNECSGNIYEEPDISNNLCVYCIDGPDSGEWCNNDGLSNDYCDTTSGCSGEVISNSAYCDIESSIGSCTYLTDDSSDPEGCADDGYLSYSWGGSWNWNILNDYSSNPDGADFYYNENSWRYDPSRLSTTCNNDGGINNVLCPAQIELPFFETWNILIAIALIVLIYVILSMKKKSGKKKKK